MTLLFLLFAIILLIAFFMFNPFIKSSEYEIIETRDFSCPSLAGFTFKYPVFKKWENVSLYQQNCDLKIKDNTNYTFITIRVSRIMLRFIGLSSLIKKSDQGVRYILDSKNEDLRLFGDLGDVSVQIIRPPIKQKDQDISGFPSDQFFKIVIESFKSTLNDTITTQPAGIQKDKSEIYIHKIAGLSDEELDERTYNQACQMPKDYLDKRYSGILRFESLPSDYKEENAGIKDPIHRYSKHRGGQYSCFFRGVYLKDFPDLKVLGIRSFRMAEFNKWSFNYPDIEGFEVKQSYNAEKESGEITYFSQKNLISEAIPYSAPVIHRHPMLIIQKMDRQTPEYSLDKRRIFSPNGSPNKIWNEHDANTISLNDPYDNLDTTIEFDLSNKEAYLITTVNFIYNGIPERQILDIVSNSFGII